MKTLHVATSPADSLAEAIRHGVDAIGYVPAYALAVLGLAYLAHVLAKSL